MSEPSSVSLQQILDRSCWVCFATDEDDRTAEWVRPCRCRGSTKWVHQSCLQRWVDEKQRGNSTARVACPQCNAEYLIEFPNLGPVVYMLDLADRLISKACPFAAAGIMVGSIYWTAVTYGAVTVMQAIGHKEGLDVMERADPLFLLIGLPTIPVMLILGKMIRWEDYVLRLWRKYSNKLQILNSIFPGIGCPVPRVPAEANPLADHVSATRILCGALVFPTIATIVGKLMFSSVNSNLQRTILDLSSFHATEVCLQCIALCKKKKKNTSRPSKYLCPWSEKANALLIQKTECDRVIYRQICPVRVDERREQKAFHGAPLGE
ncbi:E3 ubiquitin-protein ligase MARCHF5 isoform X2 [Ranitomeya imitator]|uniref:E3 ubiquitin-protein ligase MARCHF5 isoform X2 n=1 Tax=Ranitomeya imitator TaxID=111125 RepID=UPI0037E91294